HGAEEQVLRPGARARAQLRDLLGGDRRVRAEVDAVADRAHAPAERVVAEQAERAGGVAGEAAEALAQLVRHDDEVARERARELVAQRLAAPAVVQLRAEGPVR